MSEHSVLPGIHELMKQIPYPGTQWNEVITTHPSVTHLHWAFLFAILSALLQIFCWILTKIFAPICVPNYSSTPKLPTRMKTSQQNYIALGNAVNYTSPINIAKYSSSDLNKLSQQYCEGKLTEKDVRKFLLKCNKHHTECEKNDKRFQECLFPIFTKAVTFGFAVYAFHDKQWLYDSKLFWNDWPFKQNLDCCAADMKILYMAHIGWYIYKLFAQIYLDRHLKDFVASLIHHVSTVILLSGSYSYAFVRVGVVVLLLHDPADIILSTGKLFRLCKQAMLTNVAFALLVISWFLTRIVIFPYHCVLSTYIRANEVVEEDDGNMPMICAILMTALYILHLHWFRFIIQAVIRALSGNERYDPRSDTEEASDTEENNNNDADKSTKK